MQNDQRDQHLGDQVVNSGKRVAQILAHQVEKRADKGDVIVAEQPGARLQANHAKQAKDGKGAERVMALAMPLATQISLDLARGREELGKSCVGRAQQAPDQTKHDQSENRDPDLAMHINQVATQLAADKCGNDAEDERPVEDAGGQIPEPETCAVHSCPIGFLLKKAPAGALCEARRLNPSSCSRRGSPCRFHQACPFAL